MIKERAANTVLLALGAVAVAVYLAVGVYTSANALSDALGGSGCALNSVLFPLAALNKQTMQVSAHTRFSQAACFCCRVAAADNQTRLLATHHRPFHLNDFTLREYTTAVLAFLVRNFASRLSVDQEPSQFSLLTVVLRLLCFTCVVCAPVHTCKRGVVHRCLPSPMLRAWAAEHSSCPCSRCAARCCSVWRITLAHALTLC